MEIIIGLCLGVILLYFWLLGHWFARILMFPLCAGVLGLSLCALMASAEHAGPNNGPFGLLVGAALGWPLASLPIWYHRYRLRQIIDASLSLHMSR